MGSEIRSTQQKIRLFRSLFSGLNRIYGTYDPDSGKVKVVKRLVTDNVIYNHLKGVQPYGVYLLQDEKTKTAAVDFDSLDVSFPLLFVQRAAHYRLPCYVERSKSKGFHVWMFFEESGVLAAKARTVLRHILAEIECPPTEIFPKQDRLTPQKPYGNFINTPLFGRWVSQDKTVFVDPDREFQPFPDQWKILQKAQRISEQQLNEIIEINQLDDCASDENPRVETGKSKQVISHSLLPCAQTILEQGVSEYQRVACFRLAVHLKRIGFPQDIALSILIAWSKKNHPTMGKQIITETEITEQVKFAYNHPYRSYGCEDPAIQPFCNVYCPVYKKSIQKSPKRKEVRNR